MATLLNLPIELRLEIYDHILWPLVSPLWSPPFDDLPSNSRFDDYVTLLLINKQTSEEVTKLFQLKHAKHIVFYFDEPRDMIRKMEECKSVSILQRAKLNFRIYRERGANGWIIRNQPGYLSKWTDDSDEDDLYWMELWHREDLYDATTNSWHLDAEDFEVAFVDLRLNDHLLETMVLTFPTLSNEYQVWAYSWTTWDSGEESGPIPDALLGLPDTGPADTFRSRCMIMEGPLISLHVPDDPDEDWIFHENNSQFSVDFYGGQALY